MSLLSQRLMKLKKTRTAEAEARKRKHPEASPTAPSKKKRKTKKERAAPTEPLIVEPISMVRPDAERQLTIHEPAFTEAHEAEDFPAADPIAAEDIGQHDHVEDGAVLPQLENSELISIGRPLTPIAQDASWADRPQEEEDYEAQPTPTPQASSVLRRLRKGPRPQPPMKLMWSPPQQKHQKSAKPLIPLLLFPRLLPVLSSTIMLSTGLRYRSQSKDCPGSRVLHQHLDPSISMASEQTTHSSIAPGTPTQGKEYHLIGSGAIRSEAITPAFYTIKVASSHTSVLTLKQ